MWFSGIHFFKQMKVPVGGTIMYLAPGFEDNQLIGIIENRIIKMSFEPSELEMMKTLPGKEIMMKRVIEAVERELTDDEDVTHKHITVTKGGKYNG